MNDEILVKTGNQVSLERILEPTDEYSLSCLTPQEIRLQLLKLTYNHARLESEAVNRAAVLEDYVINGTTPKSNDQEPGGDGLI